ncbi:MAG: CidA/LrgA family protein [Marivibrio sp.]|uniref:CidA/LrgA family protein n=1 Tax=Marivibrio sp. TaxID=2039719 RepID=UPI0032F0492B
MLKALTVFLAFQLLGETLVRALTLPVPGPVLGMALLLIVLLLRYGKRGIGGPAGAPDWLGGTADGLLKHLSLLFVPASVGLVQHLERLQSEGAAIAVALVVSTLAAIAIGALTFVGVARLTDRRAAGEEVKGDGPPPEERAP